MSKFVVDNKELKALADSVKRMTEQLNKDAEYLRDEKADVFNRYMAYNKLRSTLKGLDAIMSLCKSSMIAGHNLQDEMFHTEAGLDNGWDEPQTFDHPFFKDEEEKDDDNEMPDILKKILAGAVLGAIVGRASNDRDEKKH
jgi:hypothetical protein